MARRKILTARQRAALFDLPTDEALRLTHCILDDDDVDFIQARRHPGNRMGFALQLCALRFPGRLLKPGEVIPEEVSLFIAAQLGLKPDDLIRYASRDETRREHLAALRKIYGYRMFTGKHAHVVKIWLAEQAEASRSSEDLVRRLVEECRRRQIILPSMSTIERMCADSLVAAERRIEARIAARLDDAMRVRLDALLEETVANGRLTRFVWLRKFEVGKNSADVNRLLDRMEFLKDLGLSPDILDGVPPHRVARLRRQGERCFADEVRDISSDRRLAILAVCVVEWRAAVADAVVETHDRIVGQTWRKAERLNKLRIEAANANVRTTLTAFQDLGSALLEAKEDNVALDTAVTASCGWTGLESLVAIAIQLTDRITFDPLADVMIGYHRFRRYAPRMLQILEIECAAALEPLLDAMFLIRDGANAGKKARPTAFLLPRSKWRRHLDMQATNADRFWQVAVMFHMRDAFRSGDIWLRDSRRYADMRQALVPIEAARATPRLLAVPFEPRTWIADRRQHMEQSLGRLARAARDGTLPGGVIENGELRLERLETDGPDGADELVLDLYRRLPDVRITDLMLEVDAATGFTDAFTHLRTGVPCKDRIGLLNVLLAEGLNLGLSKMAEASSTHDYLQLSRLSRWHVESEAIERALATLIEAQSHLPMARFWGAGRTASSDGQFFPTTHQGEAMNLVNAKYGNEPGLKAYTHVSDQFGPFATQNIPATANEAPYILDGLLMNEAGRRIREQYADTGGFTDLVFAVTALLAYRFIPRIRDLPSKRLHVFETKCVPKELKGLIGGKIRENTIIANWPDILRSAATMAAGVMRPSQLLRKFAAWPRRHDLAVALREVGRVERTLFIIDWLLDGNMQRRAQIGLNKGEAHHALKSALRIGRQGEIRHRTTEGQHFRIGGLNLLTAIIIYWNTDHLGHAVAQRTRAGFSTPEDLLAHISPLGWAQILLTGEYRWRSLGTE